MNVLRRPLTLNAPSRGVLPVVSDEPAELHAGREQRQRGVLAEMSGRARVWSPVITWPRWLESVSISGCAAVTSTFSRHLADGHLQVDAQPRADLDLDVVDERNGEAGLLGGHDKGAGLDGGKFVVAVGAGDSDDRDAGLDAGQRHFRAGHDGTRRVAHGAEDGRGIELRKRR